MRIKNLFIDGVLLRAVASLAGLLLLLSLASHCRRSNDSGVVSESDESTASGGPSAAGPASVTVSGYGEPADDGQFQTASQPTQIGGPNLALTGAAAPQVAQLTSVRIDAESGEIVRQALPPVALTAVGKSNKGTTIWGFTCTVTIPADAYLVIGGTAVQGVFAPAGATSATYAAVFNPATANQSALFSRIVINSKAGWLLANGTVDLVGLLRLGHAMTLLPAGQAFSSDAIATAFVNTNVSTIYQFNQNGVTTKEIAQALAGVASKVTAADLLAQLVAGTYSAVQAAVQTLEQILGVSSTVYNLDAASIVGSTNLPVQLLADRLAAVGYPLSAALTASTTAVTAAKGAAARLASLCNDAALPDYDAKDPSGAGQKLATEAIVTTEPPPEPPPEAVTPTSPTPTPSPNPSALPSPSPTGAAPSPTPSALASPSPTSSPTAMPTPSGSPCPQLNLQNQVNCQSQVVGP